MKQSWQEQWADRQAHCPWCDYYRLDGRRCLFYSRKRLCKYKTCPERLKDEGKEVRK